MNQGSKDERRRLFLQSSSRRVVLGLAMLSGLIRADKVWAASGYRDNIFSMSVLDDCMRALGTTAPQESKLILLTAPDLAENGALVPVDVLSQIPNTQEVALLVRHNPSALAVHFEFPNAGQEVKVSARLKMSRSSEVFAWVRADGHYYFSKKEVRVTLGGCGV